jgi:aromatic ring-cleaving dioxygenase
MLPNEQGANMDRLHPSIIDSWHAHVYFEASSREVAWALRETINAELAGLMEMGRFHEKPVGPHPMWSYQLAFLVENFSRVLGWLTLNHGALDVFVHPNTGNELRDHRDCALWLGRSHGLNLAALNS